MPLMLYGTEDNKVELRLKDISVRMRNDAKAEELIRACNYSRIMIENMSIDKFDGECLIRSKGVGGVVLSNITSTLNEEDHIKETNKDFIIEKI